jgi:ASCH domain-containing protein
MRALSIRQPYAEQILRGTKVFEYRSRPTAIRERVHIYASRKPGPAREFEGMHIEPGDLPTGVLVGTIEIIDCSGKPGDYKWHLARPRRLKRPVHPTKHPQPAWFNPF